MSPPQAPNGNAARSRWRGTALTRPHACAPLFAPSARARARRPARSTFNAQWAEAMTELLDLLEAESPEDPSLAPADLAAYSCLYIKYLQTFSKLSECYDQMVHPQKRFTVKKALEACMGRVLEVRAAMVKLNGGNDVVHLDSILVDLKLTPDVLEVTVPKFFTEDRSKELGERKTFLGALIEKFQVSVPEEHGPPVLLPLDEDEAIRVIQVNERGRQGRERARVMRSIKEQQAHELRLQRMGVEPMSRAEAAVRVQAAVRGWLARLRMRQAMHSELVFIGMRKPSRDAAVDPVLKVHKNLERRRLVQADNFTEYENAIVTLKAKVRDVEGQEMRETIQDKINT